jgi:hypothetical protein
MAEQQRSHVVLDSQATVWTDLPEYVLEAVVEHIQGEREVSAIFRRVCHAWREAHDRLVAVLKPNSARQDARMWNKFGGVKTLHLNALSGVNDVVLRALAPLTALTSLDLDDCRTVTDEGLRALLAPLTALTSLDLSGCYRVTGEGWRALLPPLTTLISLHLYSCEVSDEGVRALASLTGLTSLCLSGCSMVTKEGWRALAPLTALTTLNLEDCCILTEEGIRALLAPLTALSSLNLSVTTIDLIVISDDDSDDYNDAGQ